MRRTFPLVLLAIGCSPSPPVVLPPSVVPGKPVFAAELIAAHNKFRQSQGRSPLSPDPELQKACEQQAQYMAAKNRLSHTGSSGSSPFTRMTAAGYQWSTAGENIAFNQRDVNAVMTAWERSAGHRYNVLLAAYANIGAACVYNSKGQPYWCVDFAAPQRGRVARQLMTVTHEANGVSSIRLDPDE